MMTAGELGREVFLVKRKHLAPAVGGLVRPVGGARGIEEGVAGAVVAVKLVVLAELLEHLFGAVDVIAVGVLIVVAENAEQRRGYLLGQIDGRNRLLGVEQLLVVDHDIAAPAIDDRIETRN